MSVPTFRPQEDRDGAAMPLRSGVVWGGEGNRRRRHVVKREVRTAGMTSVLISVSVEILAPDMPEISDFRLDGRYYSAFLIIRTL